MSGNSKQNNLRDQCCHLALEAYDLGNPLEAAEAATALMGACAVVLGTLPTDRHRERCAEILSDALLDRANARAREIRDGRFDREHGQPRRRMS